MKTISGPNILMNCKLIKKKKKEKKGRSRTILKFSEVGRKLA